jgi:hypothetical protein
VSAGLVMGLRDAGRAEVPGAVALAPDGRSATFTPTSALVTTTGYTASVRASDTAGNAMAAARTWGFTTTATPDVTPPAVTATSPADGAPDAGSGSAVTATFSKPVTPSGLQFSVAGPNGTPVAGATSVSADGLSASFVPGTALTVSTKYTASVRATDRAGNRMSSATTWSFATAAASCPCTVLGDATPQKADSGDKNGVELGMRVVPAVNAVVTGVRFYKSTANTGTHTGTLWSSTGQVLATGTFTGETASGWQTLTFASPVQVVAGTTYVVSYLAPAGRYSADSGYFTGKSVSTGVLTAPASTSSAGNGLYVYGGGFPTNTHGDANYYVDVVATVEGVDTTPPAITARQPDSGASDVPLAQDVSVTFSEPVTSGSLTMSLSTGGTAVNAGTALSADGRTATLSPVSDLSPATTYTVSVKAADGVGNVAAAQTWSFTTVASESCPCTLFRAGDAPAKTANEGKPVSLGMTWSPSVNGTVSAIRFYKVAGDTGTHTGTLFGLNGAVLATGTFSDESASGWQTLTLSTPVPVTAGTNYVVAYSTSQGRFGYTAGYFSEARRAGPLTGPANSATVANGRYTYAAGSPFPVSSGNGSNYYADVVFSAS